MLFLALVLFFLICLKFNIPCLFKKIFSISCPACGMTRAIKCILKLNIIESFSYNILAFPLVIFIIISIILFIIDKIKKTNLLTNLLEKIIKHYYIILLLLLISFIINNIRKI